MDRCGGRVGSIVKNMSFFGRTMDRCDGRAGSIVKNMSFFGRTMDRCDGSSVKNMFGFWENQGQGLVKQEKMVKK